jgi:Predicted membrane protein
MPYCPACGAEVGVNADQCPECEVPLRTAGVVDQHLERVAAGVLALAFGFFGAHKFYLGRPVIGVVYILFIWTLIPPLIALLEGLLYLNSDDASFARRYADGSILGIVG